MLLYVAACCRLPQGIIDINILEILDISIVHNYNSLAAPSVYVYIYVFITSQPDYRQWLYVWSNKQTELKILKSFTIDLE